MAISLKHAFTSNVADSGDTTLVQPSNWNAEHTLTAAADTLLGAVTSGPVTEITCTAAGRAILDDANAAAQRTTLGLGTGDSPTFTDLNLSGIIRVGTGTTPAQSSIVLEKNYTGSTFISGAFVIGEVQSDVTTRFSSFNSSPGTQNALFTLGNLSHFRAFQGTFGASSTVTSQYGYLSVGNLIGGVNNFAFAALDTAAVTSGKVAYGFHSFVNTATGGGVAWAFYGAGTAPSFFAGNIGLNTTSPDARLSVNGIASFGAGAVGTPSIAAFGDLNTGMWFPAADTIAFSEGGVEVMRITSSANVGIGTSSPNGRLDVRGGTIEFDPGAGADATRAFNFNINNDNYGKILIPSGSGGAMAFWTGAAGAAAERVRISNSGNLGIGTTAPDALLSVNGIASFGDGAVGTPSITNFGDLNTGIWFPAEDTIAFSEGGVESMRINSSGFVGVGTTTIPAQVSIVGTGQAVTTAFDTAGNLGGSTLLGDSGGSVGNGGALVFSANNTVWRFAAIKGNVTSGTSNSQGDLSFYVRNAAADANLTRAMVISPTGILGIGGSAAAGFTVTANRNLTGAASAGGFLSNGVIQSDATGIPTYFSATLSTAAGSYTVGNPQLFRAVGGSIGAGSSITNLYGYVAAVLTAGTTNYNFFGSFDAASVTTGKTAFGYYDASNVATGGGVIWAFYAAGTASSYFGGNVGIGSTALSSVNLRVSRQITGATFAYGSLYDGVIQSGVTSLASGVTTFISTAAASFSTTLNHFQAIQATMGAGSSLTAQTGYLASESNIFATNNYGFLAGNTAAVTTGKTAYGFFSNINVASGGGTTWGFFANGTAWNYFAGPVILDTNLWVDAPAPTVTTGVATLTAAQIRTGIVSTTGTTYTLTLPTGTSIDSGFTGIPANVDVGFDVHFVNTASGTITIAVNTGVTSLGSLTIATGTSAHFRLRRTAANTYIIYRVA